MQNTDSIQIFKNKLKKYDTCVYIKKTYFSNVCAKNSLVYQDCWYTEAYSSSEIFLINVENENNPKSWVSMKLSLEE